jgi:GntR family transcriptional regulator
MERAFQRHTVPLYTQLANALRGRIEAGEWPVNSQLPSIAKLASEFGVAPATMRQAIEVLEQEGLLRRRHGRGTFVESEPDQRRWLSLASTWDSLVRMTDPLKPELLLVETAKQQPKIHVSEGRPVPAYQHIKRVHYHEDQPFCVIDIYLSASIYLKYPVRFCKEIIIPVLAGMVDVKIAKASQTLTIDGASQEAANYLGLPFGAPVAKVRRTITDTEGWCIYTADVIYRGDAVKLDIDLIPHFGANSTNSSFQGRKP